jgi:hypothetical protein
MTIQLKFSDLDEAFNWTSANGSYENLAYICRTTGRIWLVSDYDDIGEEPPKNVGDESLYLTVPGKKELDLGRKLALDFAREHPAARYDEVRDIFSRAGAYRRFRALLEATGTLDAWCAFEAGGTEQALRIWAEANDIELVGKINGPS